MDDKRCFVQFPHPGGDHIVPITVTTLLGTSANEIAGTTRTGGSFWSFPASGSTATGAAIRIPCGHGVNGKRNRDASDRLSRSPKGRSVHHPRYLWSPYWIPKKKSYGGLHNTDPFIFGDRILYSNCRQGAPNKRALRNLARGSVIAFGSGKKDGGKPMWVLDTVLVVRDSCWYDPLDPAQALEGKVSKTFLGVTGGPLSADPKLRDNPNERCLRLYRGATPRDPVCGMFSFFPAMPAGNDRGFARPSIELGAQYFTRANTQAPKGVTRDIDSDVVLQQLWQSLIDQVRRAGLVIGTRAESPPRREDGMSGDRF